jgi:drug/metabolite transporter (DMT)-like permease
VESETLLRKPVPLQTRAIGRGSIALPWQLAALGAILLASTGHLVIKLGLIAAGHAPSSDIGVSRIIETLFQPAVIGGLAIYGVGTLLWISAVARRNISFLYPLTALNYVIVSVGGKLWFGETISPARWTGIGIVVLGVALLQLSSGEDQ